MNALFIFALVLLLEPLNPCIANSIRYTNKYFSISFGPSAENTYSCSKNPSLKQIRAMLEAVATKYSKVSTETVGTWNAKYRQQNIYYNSSCSIAKIAEVAALINKENKNKSLSVLIGVMTFGDISDGIRRTRTELSVALEAQKIADRVYPGTVEGFQIFVDIKLLTNSDVANSGSQWIKFMKAATKLEQLRIGIVTQVQDFKRFNTWEYNRAEQARMQLVQNSDFIIIKSFPFDNGPLETFFYLTRSVNLYKPVVRALQAQFRITGKTEWSKLKNTFLKHIENTGDSNKVFDKSTTHYLFSRHINRTFKTLRNNDTDHVHVHYGYVVPLKVEIESTTSSYEDRYYSTESTQFFKIEQSNSPAIIGAIIAVAVVMIIRLLVLTIQLCKRIHKLSKQQVISCEEINEFYFECSQSHVIAKETYIFGTVMNKPYNRKLELPKNSFEIYWNQLVGCGQFGSVYKAVIKGDAWKEVALKTTKIGCPTNAMRGLLTEIKILSHLGPHPNIVTMLGAYTAELWKGKMYVALELCAIGSLERYLTRLQRKKGAYLDLERTIYISMDNLLLWSIHIATGMEHIANQGVIHSDLACRNVLLTNECVAKIADFGLSRGMNDSSIYVRKQDELVPWRWMAIESLKMNMFSSQSDVWSFGVTLWEMFSFGAKPYPGHTYNANFIGSLENGSIKMNRPIEATTQIFQVMEDCWHLQPDMRPTFTSLKDRLFEISVDVIGNKNSDESSV